MGTILKYLRDSIWQSISVIMTLILFFLSWYVAYLQRDTKALQVVILANTSLIDVEESIAKNIKIFYDNLSIDNLTLIQVKLENSGNQSIREEDYSQPIQLVFPSNVEVIEAAIVDVSPENVELSLQVDKNTVTTSNILLNPDDRIIIRLLVTDLPLNSDVQPFKAKARIAGIKDIPIIDAIEQSTNTSPSHLSSVTQREEFDNYSFLFGIIYGALALGIIALALNKIREARLKASFRNRSLSNFSDTMQANMTPTSVVKNSEQASFNFFIWNLALIIFIVITVLGLYYILLT